MEGRVAVEEACVVNLDTPTGLSNEDDCADTISTNVPMFVFEKSGLAIDEYHAYGSTAYEDEVQKRVKAALSLSRSKDACESTTTALSAYFSPQ